MKRLYITSLAILFIVFSCDNGQENVRPGGDTGYLSLAVNISLDIQKVNGRIQAVNTDIFKVEIYAEDGTLVQEFAQLIDMPPELELVAGNYYVKVHSNNLTEAAFEEPYYEGTSTVFPIKKGDVTTIQVDCELANVKVTVQYTQNVIDDFVDYQTVVTGKNGVSLAYGMTEIRAGYFEVNPLTVDATLTYAQSDGTQLTKVLSGIINAPQPKDHYIITVDAILEDGVITPILINVDETTNVIDFPRSYNTGPGGPQFGELIDDRDGQVYRTIQIGTQEWMAENLNYIPQSGSWWYYNNDPAMGDIYGVLYELNTIMNGAAFSYTVPSGVQGMCPTGWHIPSMDEWYEMENTLGGPQPVGGKAKEAGTDHWLTPNTGATNESGFTALPGGQYRSFGNTPFLELGLRSYFWTTSQGGFFGFTYDSEWRSYGGVSLNYEFGFSCRCIKD